MTTDTFDENMESSIYFFPFLLTNVSEKVIIFVHE